MPKKKRGEKEGESNSEVPEKEWCGLEEDGDKITQSPNRKSDSDDSDDLEELDDLDETENLESHGSDDDDIE